MKSKKKWNTSKRANGRERERERKKPSLEWDYECSRHDCRLNGASELAWIDMESVSGKEAEYWENMRQRGREKMSNAHGFTIESHESLRSWNKPKNNDEKNLRLQPFFYWSASECLPHC